MNRKRFSPAFLCHLSSRLGVRILATVFALGIAVGALAQGAFDHMLSQRSLKERGEPQSSQSAPEQQDAVSLDDNPVSADPHAALPSWPGNAPFFMPTPFFGHDAFAEMQRMHSQMRQRMNALFDEMHSGFPHSTALTMGLASQVQDEGDRYVVELSGVRLDTAKVDVKVEGRMLKINVKQEISRSQNGRQGMRQERRSGSLHQSVMLPGPIEPGTAAMLEQRGDALRISVKKAKDSASPAPRVQHPRRSAPAQPPVPALNEI